MLGKENDGTRWWKHLLGIEPQITAGEETKIAPGSDTAKYLASQEHHDAMRLISVGNQHNDPLLVNLGQAKLRVLQGKETIEDLELLNKRNFDI